MWEARNPCARSRLWWDDREAPAQKRVDEGRPIPAATGAPHARNPIGLLSSPVVRRSSPPTTLPLRSNRNQIASSQQKLAGKHGAGRYYAQARKFRMGGSSRSISLPGRCRLNATSAKRSGLRKSLRDTGLKDKVICLVTFFGVPLRIGERITCPVKMRAAAPDADAKASHQA